MSSISITSESQAERVEHLSRLLARRVALGLALSRSDLKSAARAAGRIRLPDIGLSPHERNEARFARATLGRAIRDARVRSFRAPTVRPASNRIEIAPRRRSRRRLAIAATLAAALALVVLLSLGTPGGPLSGLRAAVAPGRSSSQQVLDATKQSRGRTSSFTQPVAVGAPTGSPVPAATEHARPEDNDRGGGGGGGGSAGTGTGGTGFVPAPPFLTIPTPTPTPTVYTRFHGRVLDATTGAPVPGVCIVIGSLDCGPNKPHSDAGGYWEATVTLQPYWDFGWQKTGYQSFLERLYSFGRQDVLVPDIKLSH